MGRWIENFVLLCIPVCGIYIYMSVYMCRMFITRECMENLWTRLKTGNDRLGKPAMEVTRLVYDEENDSRFEVQRKEH